MPTPQGDAIDPGEVDPTLEAEFAACRAPRLRFYTQDTPDRT